MKPMNDPYEMIPVHVAEQQLAELLAMRVFILGAKLIEAGIIDQDALIALDREALAEFDAFIEQRWQAAEEAQARHDRGECSCFNHENEGRGEVHVGAGRDDLLALLQTIFDLPDADEPPTLTA